MKHASLLRVESLEQVRHRETAYRSCQLKYIRRKCRKKQLQLKFLTCCFLPGLGVGRGGGGGIESSGRVAFSLFLFPFLIFCFCLFFFCKVKSIPKNGLLEAKSKIGGCVNAMRCSFAWGPLPRVIIIWLRTSCNDR